MTLHTQYRRANPRLGIYFSIFAAIVIGLIFFLLIIEQLGADELSIRFVMIGSVLGLFALIAVLAFTLDVTDFFVVGHRVPAFFNGLGLSVTALGSVGALSLTGIFFHGGFDALPLAMGLMAGMVLMGLLIAPYFSKFGAYTVPGYLGGRFNSRVLRFTFAFLVILPCFIFLLAEIQIGSALLGMVIDRSPDVAIKAFTGLVAFMIVWGGARGLIWTNGAQGIVSLIAILVLPVIAAVLLTNLPVPQITYGTLLDDLSRLESEYGLRPITAQSGNIGELLEMGARNLEKPYLQAFGSIDRIEFILIIATLMAGISAAPHMLVRLSTASGVSEIRRGVGWGALFLGLILLTIPVIAVFVRYSIFDKWVGLTPDQLPQILDMFTRAGFINVDQNTDNLSIADLEISREAALLLFPAVHDFPEIFTHLVVAGMIAMALAAASAHLMAMSTMVTLDIGSIGEEDIGHNLRQTVIVRVLMVIFGGLAGWGVLSWRIDPLELFVYGLQLTSAIGFPVMILSIWWKRFNHWGALAGMISGFTVTLGYMVSVKMGYAPELLGLDHRLAAIFGLPAGFAAAIFVSLLTPAPGTEQIELVRDMRIPGGETLYDRTMRFARLKAQRTQNRK